MNLHVLLFIHIVFFVRFLYSSNCDKDICFLAQVEEEKRVFKTMLNHILWYANLNVYFFYLNETKWKK